MFGVRTLLGIGASFSLVYVYNAWHTRRLFGRRIAQNLTSPDPDLRRNAADMLASESSAVPEDVRVRVLAAGRADEDAVSLVPGSFEVGKGVGQPAAGAGSSDY